MGASFFFKALQNSAQGGAREVGIPFPQNLLPGEGQTGEVLLPLAGLLVIASLLLGSLFWLSRHFEIKTKEHLNEFRKNWNKLEKQSIASTPKKVISPRSFIRSL